MQGRGSAAVGSGSHGVLAAALLASAVSSCRFAAPPPAAPDEQIVTAGAAPARVDLAGVPLAPGFAEYLLPVARQGRRAAQIWLPESAAPRTLVILLHGTVPSAPARVGAGARAQAKRLLECLAAPAFAELDPIIIAPQSPTGQWWQTADTELVLGLVVAAVARWPALAQRRVITGYSNGGLGTWFFARLYASFFDAAIPMAFNETIVGPSALPIYAIQGDKDEQFEIERVRAAVQALAAQGRDVTFDEKYRGSHLEACSYAPELGAAAHWLEQHAFPLAARKPAEPSSAATPAVGRLLDGRR